MTEKAGRILDLD